MFIFPKEFVVTDSGSQSGLAQSELWPSLPLEEWEATRATLHMWTQVVGKIRLAQTPLVNHWWNVPLYVSARGLTTSAMPYDHRTFEMEFDFIDHKLVIRTSRGESREIELRPRSVADFYHKVMLRLRELGIEVHIWTMPVEIADPIAFEKDDLHAAYDAEYASRFWRILLRTSRVFEDFRALFIGKCSPVHFFWGSFDLAVTRFSGRRAPEREGADPITREAYSHEVISHGFWPGSGPIKAPAFYSYTAPEPPGLAAEKIGPAGAFYHDEMKEFLLYYDDLRRAASPEDALTEFLQTTYEAGARLADWDRASLER
jgi:hypothetical protein